MARRIALLWTIQNRYRSPQRSPNVVAKRSDVSAAASRQVVEKHRLAKGSVLRLRLANGYPDFVVLNPNQSTECGTQRDAERQRRHLVNKSFDLQFENIGIAASSERKPALDSESLTVTFASAVAVSTTSEPHMPWP